MPRLHRSVGTARAKPECVCRPVQWRDLGDGPVMITFTVIGHAQPTGQHEGHA